MIKLSGRIKTAMLLMLMALPAFADNTKSTLAFDIPAQPVDEHATDAAKGMYRFLLQNFGVKTISGMMTGDMASDTGDVTRHSDIRAVYGVSGKYPALVGFDFMNATGRMEADNWHKAYTRSCIRLAKDTYSRGGLPAFTWHWRDPSRSTDAFYTNDTNMKISSAMNDDGSWNEASPLYQNLIKDIDTVADYLLELQAAGVACIFRPLHEASGGWFWWGREGATPFRKLYKLIFDEMVKVKGVHNVIWVWNAGADDKDWNPGDELYDIVSADIYNDAYDYSSSCAMFNDLKALTGGKKMIALSENGPIPDIDREVEDGAVWSWWMPWYDTWGGKFVSKTSKEEWQKCMNDSRVITLEDLSEGWRDRTAITATNAEAQGPMTHYLFAYFTNNTTEGQQVCYATSENGLDFEPLNGGRPVLASDSISRSGGVRDPHLLRTDDGWFLQVLTDMDFSKGKWTGLGIVLLRSRDLIHWEHHAIHFPERYAGTRYATVNAVWAPQTIYDPESEKYMVYFSLHSEKDGPFPKDAVYYAYANADFSDLEGEPQPLFSYPDPTIDTDIVRTADGLYHIFFNTWGGKEGLTRRQFTATSLHDSDGWTLVPGRMQPNTLASEGSTAYPLIGSSDWILCYDCFRDGIFQFCRTQDLRTFTLERTTKTTGMFTPRHGSVIHITEQEYQRLRHAYATF